MSDQNDEQPAPPSISGNGDGPPRPGVGTDMSEPSGRPPKDDKSVLASQLKSLETDGFQRALLWAAGYDDPELIAACPPGEIASAMTRGALMYLYTIILMIEFNVIGHNAAHSSFSPMIIIGSVFFACFFGLVDQYVLLRASLFNDGMTTMLRGGFGVNIRLGANMGSRIARWVRIGLMVLMASELALFAGLGLNRAAIDARLAARESSQNKDALQKGTKDLDSRRALAAANYETALNAQKALAPEVSRLVQQANRNSSAKAADRLNANEARLDKLNTKVLDARNALDALDAARVAELDKLRKSPGWIPRDDSFIGSVEALFEEIAEHPLAALGMVGVGLVIIGTDLVVLTLKAIGMPSAYAMMDTRRHLRLMVQQARLATADTAASEPAPPLAPDEPAQASSNERERRRAGRPLGSKNKKHLNGKQGEAHHE